MNGLAAEQIQPSPLPLHSKFFCRASRRNSGGSLWPTLSSTSRMPSEFAPPQRFVNLFRTLKHFMITVGWKNCVLLPADDEKRPRRDQRADDREVPQL